MITEAHRRKLRLGPRKYEVFHANGSVGVQRNVRSRPKTSAGWRRWHTEGETLILVYPGNHRNGDGRLADSYHTSLPPPPTTEVGGYRQEYERSP